MESGALVMEYRALLIEDSNVLTDYSLSWNTGLFLKNIGLSTEERALLSFDKVVCW